MSFPDNFKVKIKKGKVRLSIRLNDGTVIVKECTIQEFEHLIAKYKSECKKKL